MQIHRTVEVQVNEEELDSMEVSEDDNENQQGDEEMDIDIDLVERSNFKDDKFLRRGKTL